MKLTANIFHQQAKQRLSVLWFRFKQVWQKLSQRERVLVSLMLTLLSLALIWLIAINPVLQIIKHTNQQLPLVGQQLAEIKSVLRQAKSLQRHQPVSITFQQGEHYITSALQKTELDNNSSLQTLAEQEFWQLTLKQAPAVAVINCINDIVSNPQVRINKLDLSRTISDGLEMPGLVDGSIEFVFSEPDYD